MENITSSKLFTTRQGTVLLGVIAAVIAAIALIVYLNHYRNSVAAQDVNVLVANKTIPQGMTGDDLAKATGFYVIRGIPKDQVLTGAITDTSTLSGKVALADIKPNSQLTEAQFGAPSGLAPQLAPGQRAVVVALGLAAVGRRAGRPGQPRRRLGDDQRPGVERRLAADRQAAVPEHGGHERRGRRERHAHGDGEAGRDS